MAKCPENLAPGKSVHGTRSLFDEAQWQRRDRMLRAYLLSLAKDDQAQVLRDCERDLFELGLDPAS